MTIRYKLFKQTHEETVRKQYLDYMVVLHDSAVLHMI